VFGAEGCLTFYSPAISTACRAGEAFLDEESEIISPEWHREILEERKRKIETGKAEFISIEKLRASRKS
jgi:hypothetical protein